MQIDQQMITDGGFLKGDEGFDLSWRRYIIIYVEELKLVMYVLFILLFDIFAILYLHHH